MRALIYDPDTAHGVRFDEIDEPRPQASQALIKVETASLTSASSPSLPGKCAQARSSARTRPGSW